VPFALTVLAAFALLYWATLTAACVRAALKVPHLEDDLSPEPARWPTVSLLVPARDEAEGVEAALRSKLAIDYPALEVVFIDDRSTDGTGEIADRLAAEDARLKVVHIGALPPGWLGKVHALNEGAKVAVGEWLLPTDADIHFAPATLKKAMARCLRRGDDVLAAFPEFSSSTLLIDMVLSDFARTVLAPMQVDQIEDPATGFGVGVGVFTLVRRAAYDASPGWEWLKLEVGDDVTLGMMLKRSGAKCALVLARSYLKLTMYPTFGSLVRGVAKSACTLSRYRLAAHLPLMGMLLAMDLLPWLALGFGWAWGDPLLMLLGALGIALGVVSAGVALQVLGQRPWKAVLSPVGAVLFHLVMLFTGLANFWRGSLSWRDTTYTLAELRAGMRFKLPFQK
jgi:hypothetical protein